MIIDPKIHNHILLNNSLSVRHRESGFKIEGGYLFGGRGLDGVIEPIESEFSATIYLAVAIDPTNFNPAGAFLLNGPDLLEIIESNEYFVAYTRVNSAGAKESLTRGDLIYLKTQSDFRRLGFHYLLTKFGDGFYLQISGLRIGFGTLLELEDGMMVIKTPDNKGQFIFGVNLSIEDFESTIVGFEFKREFSAADTNKVERNEDWTWPEISGSLFVPLALIDLDRKSFTSYYERGLFLSLNMNSRLGVWRKSGPGFSL